VKLVHLVGLITKKHISCQSHLFFTIKVVSVMKVGRTMRLLPRLRLPEWSTNTCGSGVSTPSHSTSHWDNGQKCDTHRSPPC